MLVLYTERKLQRKRERESRGTVSSEADLPDADSLELPSESKGIILLLYVYVYIIDFKGRQCASSKSALLFTPYYYRGTLSFLIFCTIYDISFNNEHSNFYAFPNHSFQLNRAVSREI